MRLGTTRLTLSTLILLSGCSEPVSVEDAQSFIAATETELEGRREYSARIAWIQANFITDDTDWLAARVDAEDTTRAVALANETKRFEGLELPEDLARKMNILQTGIVLPAPSRPGASEELAEVSTWLGSTYARGEFTVGDKTYDLQTAENVIDTSRDPAELKAVWEGWQTIAVPMRDRYARLVEIANEGARELGFTDLAEMWLSRYEMSPEAMETEVDRLWEEVRPLYEALHCHVRARLNEHYGDEVQPAMGLIRADLLGNMWGQQWGNIYDLVAPEDDDSRIDLTAILNARAYTPEDMIRTGDRFFTSLGFEPLPDTFWQRSLITKPRDRDVQCHASAWSIDGHDDVRIKMCTQINAEDFNTIHHELGHNFYQRAYAGQDPLFRTGAHDGFHEAVGDFIALSVTPEYLVEIGFIDEAPDATADIGLLLRQALNKIAFLPFGLLVDQWRWRVLRGDVTPEQYNDLWWELRARYQGLRAPGERPADAFDPGAKYHIPASTPYLRYFLSYVMQFQLHEAACRMMGWEGALHRCSIYGSEEVGARLNAMLELGASRPWPEALEAFAGTREMDGSAISEYFAPLMAYLEEQNRGRTCGW
jgi:peptidyl-dipeptidase A